MKNALFAFAFPALLAIFCTLPGICAQEPPEATAVARYGQADPIDIGEVNITAKKYTDSIQNTTMPVSVTTAEEIALEMPSSLGDVLNNEPGLSAAEFGPGTVRPMIRGLYGDRVLILVDGVRLSEEQGTSNHALSIETSRIERIEAVRGPASILYGSDALGGVINIITKKSGVHQGQSWSYSGSLSSSYSSVNQGKKESLFVQGGRDGFSFYLNDTYNETSNIETARGKIPHTFHEGNALSAGVRYDGANSTVDFSYDHSVADIGVPNNGFIVSHFDGEKHQKRTIRYSRHNPGRNVEEIRAMYDFQTHNRHMNIVNPAGGKVDIWLDIDTGTLQLDTIIQAGPSNRMTAGIQAFREEADSRRIFPSAIYNGVPVIPSSERNSAGAYIQEEYRAGDRISLLGGIRYDTVESSSDGAAGHAISSPVSGRDGSFSFNGGMVYRLDGRTDITSNIGSAFRAPNLLEKYFFGPHNVAGTVEYGSPDLDPEKSINLDMGLNYRGSRSTTRISVFRNAIDDYIDLANTGTTDGNGLTIYQFRNVREAVLYGMEAGNEYQLGNGLEVFTGISYVRGKDDTSGDNLGRIPPLKALYGMRYRKKGHGITWWEVKFTSAAAQKKTAANEDAASGWTTIDLHLNYSFAKGPSVIIGIENVLDKSYHDHLSGITWTNEQPGRNFEAGVNWNF